MESMEKKYPFLDDGNIRIENRHCVCNHSSDPSGTIYDSMNSFKEEIETKLNELLDAINESKNEDKTCNVDIYDKVLLMLKEIKLDIINEYAIRSKAIFKLEEKIKHLEVDMKYLTFVKFDEMNKNMKKLEKEVEELKK